MLWKAGLPYTFAGIMIAFGGIWLIKNLMNDHPWQNAILLVWLAIFWSVYQPLFYRRIRLIKAQTDRGQSSCEAVKKALY